MSLWKLKQLFSDMSPCYYMYQVFIFHFLYFLHFFSAFMEYFLNTAVIFHVCMHNAHLLPITLCPRTNITLFLHHLLQIWPVTDSSSTLVHPLHISSKWRTCSWTTKWQFHYKISDSWFINSTKLTKNIWSYDFCWH